MKTNGFEEQKCTCIVVDDEPQASAELSKLLSEFSQIHIIATHSDPDVAILDIIKQKPELLFLDIQMPSKDGFQVLEALNKTTVKPFVIFVTAFDRFAIQAIRASALDYLLKPVDSDELRLAIERFCVKRHQLQLEKSYSSLIEQVARKKLKFNTTGGFILIDPQDILYIQADWNYSEIHYSKVKFETVSLNLGAVESMLPKGCFARINRSVIVNLSYLDKVQRTKQRCILKKDDETVEFSIPLLKSRFLEKLF